MHKITAFCSLTSESLEGLKGKLETWNGKLELKELKLNLKETKWMIIGEKNFRKEGKFH